MKQLHEVNEKVIVDDPGYEETLDLLNYTEEMYLRANCDLASESSQQLVKIVQA